MLSAFLLLCQEIIALLLPPPSLINSLPQLLAVKHNEIPLGLRWLALGCANFQFIDIILIHLQSHNLGQRHDVVDCRLHRQCLKSLKVTFENALQQGRHVYRDCGTTAPPTFFSAWIKLLIYLVLLVISKSINKINF
ncbi:hypothetical protein AVEN_211509-1 [Araneus ventricosus]|uniref:Uncharacterized protein n=1 Tax=Araneus ventricosus TaxID=182803 RepID=A0A4Y2JMN9_ARAVE|nr:hypothetical protein AVEN_211509-1 [Araneus ventricosus]